MITGNALTHDSPDVGDSRLDPSATNEYAMFCLMRGVDDVDAAIAHAVTIDRACTWAYALATYQDTAAAAAETERAEAARAAAAETARVEAARAAAAETERAAAAEAAARMRPSGVEERRRLFASKFDGLFGH